MRATISAGRLSRLLRSHHESQPSQSHGSSESVAVPILLLEQHGFGRSAPAAFRTSRTVTAFLSPRLGYGRDECRLQATDHPAGPWVPDVGAQSAVAVWSSARHRA